MEVIVVIEASAAVGGTNGKEFVDDINRLDNREDGEFVTEKLDKEIIGGCG